MPNVMRSRSYALLFWGDFVSKIGSLFYSLAVSFYILEITGNNAIIQGAYLAVAGVVSFAFTPLGGVLADRWDKVKIIYGADFIRGAVILAAAFLIRHTRNQVTAQLTVLFAVNIICNVCGALFGPASGSIIKFLVREEQLQQATSYFSTAQSIESIAGTLLAGICYASFGVFWVLIIDGVSFLLSGVSELFIRCERPQMDGRLSVRTVLTDMAEGFGYVRANRPLMAMIVVALGLNMFVNPLFGNGVPYLCNLYLADVGGWLGFMTKELWLASFDIAISIGLLVVSLILGTRVQKARCGGDIKRAIGGMGLMMLVNLVCYFVLVELMRLPGAYALSLTAGCLILGMLMGCVNIPINVAMMRVTAPAMLGKVTGITSTTTMALIPVGNMLGGLLIAWRGLPALFIFCTAGFVAMTVFALQSKPLSDL